MLIAGWRGAADLRRIGSGHTGATNTMRAAGWPAGVAVAVLDAAKGVAAVWLGFRFGAEWLVPLAGASVVAGQCWPPMRRWGGGMGVATAAGCMLAGWPLGFVLAVGLDSLLTLLLRHAARANVISGLLVAPLFWLAGAEPMQVGLSLAVGLVVALRAQKDWRRHYTELWLDRASERSEAER